jgi:hypothetical protein
MTEQRNAPDKRFVFSRKLWIAGAVTGSLLVLALAKVVVFTSEQILDFFKWLLGLLLGSHALTDVASIVVNGRKGKPQ